MQATAFVGPFIDSGIVLAQFTESLDITAIFMNFRQNSGALQAELYHKA